MLSPSHIIIVNDFAYINGGASQVALSSAIALARNGYRVSLFAAVGPAMPELEKAGVEVSLLNQYEIVNDPNRNRALMQGLWNTCAYRELLSLLEKCDNNNTVVHVHGWTKSLSSSVFAAIQRSNIPYVITIHDFFLTCPNGGLFDYRKNAICHLPPLSLRCITTNCDKRQYPHKIWRVVRQVTQKYFGNVPGRLQHVITISDLSERIMRSYLPAKTPVYRVTNPVFIDKKPPATPAYNKSFVYVGRLDPEKGPLLFAESSVKAGVQALFVGDGVCHEQVKQIAPSAMITGWLPPKRVEQELMAARALVFPSLWYETLGLTVLEAAAVGVPAIIPDTSAAVEMVEEEVTGFIFKNGDVDELTEKIVQLNDPETASRMGKAAYERYWDAPSTVENHVAQLEQVYRKMAGYTRVDKPTEKELVEIA